MGRSRILAERREGTRITRLAKGLILVSVPVESGLDARAARLLSASERAVVELALGGLSNAAIAKARRASARTIANQLASAYKKLDIGGRRELLARFGK